MKLDKDDIDIAFNNSSMPDWMLKKESPTEAKPLTSIAQVKLYELIQLLEDLIPIGKTVVNRIPTQYFREPMFIRVNLFERYINRIEVMIPLMRQWEKNPVVEDSIGLIMRGCLVDALYQFHLDDVHSKVKSCPSPEESEYLQVASDLLADHIFSGVKYLKGAKDAGVFTNEFYKEGIDSWKEKYRKYFKNEPIDYDKPVDNITARPFPPPIKILKSIRNSEWLNRHKPDQLYMSYFFYSKYEHFGATTNALQNTDMNTLFYFMMDSMTYILLACQMACGHFENANDKYNQENKEKIYGLKEESDKIYSIREEFLRIVNTNRPAEHFL
jgi:hypothetical protein